MTPYNTSNNYFICFAVRNICSRIRSISKYWLYLLCRAESSEYTLSRLLRCDRDIHRQQNSFFSIKQHTGELNLHDLRIKVFNMFIYFTHLISKITIYAFNTPKINDYIDFALETAKKTFDYLETSYLNDNQISVSKIGTPHKYAFFPANIV